MKKLATIETEKGSILLIENNKGELKTSSEIKKYDGIETTKANYFPEVTNLLDDVMTLLNLDFIEFDYIIHLKELDEATEEIY